MMISLAQGAGVANDPTIRQDLVRLYTMSQLGRINNLRVKAAKAKGEEIAGMGNIAKLSMSDMVRLQRDLGLRIAGPQGMLHAYDSEKPQGARRGDRQPVPRLRHRDGAVRPGAADLRRHRPGAEEHHRRARPRPAEGAEPGQGRPVQRAPQEHLTPGSMQQGSDPCCNSGAQRPSIP
jgi:hypothetical protein